MLGYLRRAGSPVAHVQVPYEKLNGRLNDFNGVVAATLEARVRWGKFGRAIERKWPGAALELGPDIEPMLKTFEIGGAGAAPLLAPSPDLAPLGFLDGTTAVIWSDFAELVDVVRASVDEPERTHRIGRAARRLVHERHTWDHRALELAAIIRRVRGEDG
jgi:glycosyltransferase involved in cell wall biosynthesis